jgi:hypothetical protein
MSAKKIKIIYWIFTALFAAFMLLSSIPDIIMHPEAIAIVNTRLGYPTYFLPFLGVAKLLGVIAVLVPGFPRLKEWAYAGFVFDLLAAMYSHISVGDPASQWMIIFLPLLLLVGSYVFHHKKLKAASSIAPAN